MLRNKWLCFIFIIVIAINLFSDQKADNLELKERSLPEHHDECHFCHSKQSKRFMPGIKKPQRYHVGKSNQHGKKDISCFSCHDVNNSAYLISTLSMPADFRNSSSACQHCHTEEYKDWIEGLHGKRLGGWNLPKIQFHCIDCHDPHSVTFKKMPAFPPPQIPYLGIPRKEEKHK